MVGTGKLHMTGLDGCRLHMSVTGCRLFRRCWPGADATISTVIADMIYGGVVDHSLVVDIVNIRDIYVIHRTIVVEGAVVPISALIAGATVAISVVDSAIEANMWTPVTGIPGIVISIPTPISRGPEHARGGGHHPSAGHPEIALITISPVARRPQIAVSWNLGLRVNGKGGRSNRDSYAYLRE